MTFISPPYHEQPPRQTMSPLFGLEELSKPISAQFAGHIDRGARLLKILAKRQNVSDNDTMNEPLTRPELDAKLGTIEAKMDGRLARIEDRFSSIDHQFSDIREILNDQKNTAWKAAGAVIATFVAVFAIYVSAFDSGRDTAKVAAEAQIQTSAALAEIRQIVNELKAQPK